MLINKILIITCLLISINSVSYSQSGWVQINSGTTSYLRSVYFVNAYTGYIVGSNNTILRTTDGGINWDSSYSNSMITYSFYTVYFINSSTGFIGAVYPGPPPLITYYRILKTNNSGIDWIPNGGVPASCFCFTDQNTGYTVGLHLITKTTNAGNNWTIQYLYQGTNLNSIHFPTESIGFIVGNYNSYGLIYKTLDAGEQWEKIDSSYLWDYYSTCFINSNTGFVIGVDDNGAPDKSLIIKTTNSGLNWQSYSNNYHSILRAVRFVNQNTGFIFGNNGIILKTTNQGLSWNLQEIPFTNVINDAFLINPNLGIAVGSNGLILKTTNGGEPIGIKPISSEVPNSFSLSQNYPNPFNPVTKIKFDIPPSKGARGMIAQLIIYDALGREIAVLVNEQLLPSTYEAEWDATDYPSGVYFYKLTAGDFMEIKKMVLIK